MEPKTNDLIHEVRELLKKCQEVLDKAEALSKPEPVTACVGDELISTLSGTRAWVMDPSGRNRDIRNRVHVIFEDGSTGNHLLSGFTTPDGRQIDGVVPFRITRLESGRWTYHPNGKDRGWGSLGDLKSHCSELAKSLWPWYDGPAYIVEK